MTLHPQPRIRESEYLCSACFLRLIQLGVPPHGMAPFTVRTGLQLINLIYVITHRCAQRFVSEMIPDPIKLLAITTADSCSNITNIQAVLSQGFNATVYYRPLIICQKYVVSEQMFIIAFKSLRIMS